MSAAVWPVNANCPRCGGPFRCGVSDEHCACFGLQISPLLRAQLAAPYSACLCMNCLSELEQEQNRQPAPRP